MLTDRYKKKSALIEQRRKDLAYERAKVIADEVINSEQFQLAVTASKDDIKASVDVILRRSVNSVMDNRAQFLDTMRSKGLPTAYIRKFVHNIYDLLGEPEATYEEMENAVADYMAVHPELYNSVIDATAEELKERIEKNE